MTENHDLLKLFVRCRNCDGRGFYLRETSLAEGELPPRTAWCNWCKRRGLLLTPLGEQLLRFVDSHLDDFRNGTFEVAR